MVGAKVACVMALAVLTARSIGRRTIIRERASALADFQGQQVPKASSNIIRQAREIASGTVFFYNHIPVHVGLRGIDWSGKLVHHQEWPAQLNRFFYLETLAAAYKASGDERYARTARAYIEDWIRQSHYDSPVAFQPGDNGLSMSIRLGSSVDGGWGGTLPVFLGSAAFNDRFLDLLFQSIDRQAAFLSSHLSKGGNWRISELDALVFTALRFPFLPDASRLLAAGTAGMRSALARQFLPDGAHVERTPSYAYSMTNVLANYYELQRLFPKLNFGVDPALLARALDYAADSDLSGFNDSMARARDPAKLPGLAFRADTIHRLNLDVAPLPPLAEVFPAAGQVFLRSAFRPGADYLAFDAGTWGGGHCHLSRLSFVFRSGGRLLIADPGILNYEMNDPLAAYGKSTEAHSTLNIGGWNQSSVDAHLLHTEFTQAVALIQADWHGNYWPDLYTWTFHQDGPGTYGNHERILLWVKGAYLLVLDSMRADPGSEVHNVWQLGPMDKWSSDPSEFSWWSENSDTNLFLQLVSPPPRTVMQCFEGSRDPLRGWIGWHGYDAQPAPQVEFRYPIKGPVPVISAVLLVPYSGTTRPHYSVTGDRDLSRAAIHHLQIRRPDGSMDALVWSSGLSLPVDHTAALVWIHKDAAGHELRRFTWPPRR